MIKENAKKNLEYIGIEPENIDMLTLNLNTSNLSISKLLDEKENRVYKTIPIEKIELYVTPHTSSETFEKKYEDAVSLKTVLNTIKGQYDKLKSELETEEKINKTLKEDDEKERLNLKKLNNFLLEKQNITENQSYNKLLYIIENLDIDKLEKLEEIQTRVNKKTPFRVTYDKAQNFNIYCANNTDKYLMFLCVEDNDFSAFFYILKKRIEIEKQKAKKRKIETKNLEKNKSEEKIEKAQVEEKTDKSKESAKEVEFAELKLNETETEYEVKISGLKEEILEYIYVPITGLEISERYLTKEEQLLIEEYLWYYTKNWPTIYEYFDKQGRYSVIITGEINLYHELKSVYSIKFTEKEELQKLYKLLTAIFTVEKETSKKQSFKAEISATGGLEFKSSKDDETVLDLKEFSKLLYNEYNNLYSELILYAEQNEIKSNKRELIFAEMKAKEEKLLALQNEITLFSEAKKSFFGKFKYFLKKDPLKKVEEEIKEKQQHETESKLKEENEEKEEILKEKQAKVEEKYTKYLLESEFCTIDEYILLYKEFDKENNLLKNNLSDINNMKLAVKNLEKKIENSKLYLEEISMNKKNIFNFFKFTNSGTISSLAEGEIETADININNKSATFDINLDFEIFGEKIDNMQREILTKDELDALALSAMGFMKYLNMFRDDEIDEVVFEHLLKDLNVEFEVTKENQNLEYDIFGASATYKIRYLNEKSFREADRNKFAILKYHKNMTVKELKEKLNIAAINLETAIAKIGVGTEMNVYKIGNWSSNLKSKQFDIFNIDINDEVVNMEKEDISYNLFMLHLVEDINILAYSNIAFFENKNKTLPSGMDVSSQIVLDMNSIFAKRVGKKKVKYVVIKDDNAKIITLNIEVCEAKKNKVD